MGTLRFARRTLALPILGSVRLLFLNKPLEAKLNTRNPAMATRSNHLRRLHDKIDQLPPERQAEVEDFVEFLSHKDRDRGLVRAATNASQSSFAKVWENPDDAAYDAL